MSEFSLRKFKVKGAEAQNSFLERGDQGNPAVRSVRERSATEGCRAWGEIFDLI